MPLGDWYSITEVCNSTELSYHQVLHWVRRHLQAAEPPEWVRRTTKGLMVHQVGLDLLRREMPAATPKKGGA
jgi:hypothetical protein